MFIHSWSSKRGRAHHPELMRSNIHINRHQPGVEPRTGSKTGGIMQTSARNRFSGIVKEVKRGAVNDEVELEIPRGIRIVAVLTHSSTESLGLKAGIEAFALIKSSSVILATAFDGVRLSARNQLPGKVASVVPGAVNSEVIVDIGGESRIAAIITNASVQSLGLKAGAPVLALFKASSVILGTTE
jgi:molybdate transport system regulatory protein